MARDRVPDPSSYGWPSTPSAPAGTTLARDAGTLSRCQTARSSRTAMPILVSKRMPPACRRRPGSGLNAGAAGTIVGRVSAGRGVEDWARYWRSPDLPVEAMHAHFARHVYHRHSHETYSFGVTESGAQTFTCRGGSYTSATGMVMAFNPDDPHDGHATDELGFTYRMVHIGPDLVGDVLADRTGRPAGL